MTTPDKIAPPGTSSAGGAAVSRLPDWIEALADSEPHHDIGPDSPYRQAYLMAKTAHADQTDKVGRDYFGAHVLRVTARAAFLALPAPTEIVEKVVLTALLHDVVEDTPITLGDIEREFGKDVRDDVDAVSHRTFGTHRNGSPKWEPYTELILRACDRPVSTVVKLADNRVNYEGLGDIPDSATRQRLSWKYRKAYNKLWPAYLARFGQQPPVVELQWENEAGDRR